MSHLLGLLSGVLKALAVVGACVALALACFWSYRKTTKSISFGWRGFLGFLRVVAVALVLLCLFQPSFERREAITEKANVVLLVDCSRSMEIADEAGGMTRAAATQACLERNRKRLEVLAEQYQMRRYQFAREMEKLDETGAAGVDRDVTALGDALMMALREMKGQRAAGVLIFGDGATNYGMDAEPVAQLYHDQSIPIYAVGFGKTRGAALTRDVRAENIRCARSVFARNVLPVTAEFLAVGCAGLAVTIELKFDGKVVDRQQVNIKNADETLRVSFEFSPEEVGAHKVSVAAVPVERETVMTNNETSTFVNVLEGGVKVAYFEAKPRIEQKFLKRSIEAAGGVELKPFLVLGQAAPVKGRAAWQPTYDWATYDAVIFGDITVSAFSSVDQRTLKDAVEKKGVGFMMIGGFQNFGAGGYVGTPVADLLPVKISPADKQSDEAFRLQPGTAAMGSFILRIADTPAQSERSWVALPELRGFVGVSGVKPAAHVLATDGRGAPILVVQQFGKGRTGAFMADTTWRWAFADPESADKGAQAADWSECHRRFWRQLILWLAGKDSAGKDRVWLVLNKFRFQRGEPVVVTAHVEDPSGNPIPNVEVDGTLIQAPEEAPSPAPENTESTAPKEEGKATGKQPDAPVKPEPVPPAPAVAKTYPVTFAQGERRYTTTLAPQQSGEYKVRVSAKHEGNVIGEDESSFVVIAPNVELENPLANWSLLGRLATATGGKFVTPAACEDVLAQLEHRKPDAVVYKTHRVTLWDRPFIFWLFALALCLEWLIRKLLGLI